MSWPYFRATVATGIAAVLVISCGDNGEKPESPGTGNGSDAGVVQIRGGERLGWSQTASTVGELRAHSFRLYVDGAELRLSETQCAEALGPSGYACTARLPAMPPGRHVLELTAVLNGQESTRSSSVTVMVLASSQAGFDDARVRAGAADAGEAGATPLAAGLRDVSWLTPVPDGRLLFVEDNRTIRVIEGDALLPEPAYVTDRPETTIAGMAVDPRFEETRAVYLALTEPGRDALRELGITRFREIGNRLGQGAVIVSGLPFPAEGLAPIGVDEDGLVYVAMPALDAAPARGDASFSSFVLRFTADGRVPASNPRMSPILAAGFAEPRALAIDPAGRRVWLAGSHPAWRHSVASFPLDADDRAPWPQLPQPGLPREADEADRPVSMLSIDFTRQHTAGAVLSLVSARGVQRGTPDTGGRITMLQAVNTGSHANVAAIVTASDGHTYAAVGGAGQFASIVRLPTR